jgi:hypothetical protein
MLGQIIVYRLCGISTLGDSPNHERLATAHIAGGKHTRD